MNITINTPLDEILQLWVNHSKILIEKGSYSGKDLDNIKLINKTLEIKGIGAIMIEQIESSSYTISYASRCGRIKKELPVT